jgi:hypothetical protein
VSPSKPGRAGHVEWHGSLKEQLDLIAAVQHNCECTFDRGDGSRTTTCPPHAMLANDQRALDGLLWNRRLVTLLLAEEGVTGAGR